MFIVAWRVAMSLGVNRTEVPIGRMFVSLLALTAALALSPLLHAAPEVWADDESETELAKKTQNPVADLISVPFQSNFNFNTGTKEETVRFQIQFLFPK
jgi:hypothetical protein